MSASSKYNKYSSIEHVRARPDTYIGSVDNVTEIRWMYNQELNKMEREEVTYNPGLEQCAMELITNSVDHSSDPANKVTYINVNITDKAIEVINDGTGIPVEKHEKFDMYIPELVFGNMFSGSNFKDKKFTAGKNGIGAKAANIFSTSFKLETVFNGQKYEQTFMDQLRNKTEPKITKIKKKDYTKIVFEPCLKAFNMEMLHENDTMRLIHKRVVDASAVTGKKISVSFNGVKIGVKDFQDYMDLYIGDKTKTPRFFIENERWSVGFALNPYATHVHVSFVNGICTEEGGSHVSYVTDPVVNRVVKELQSKNKDIDINKTYIKDNIIVFVKALIEDPTFSAQTKHFHTTQYSKFGSKFVLEDVHIKKIIKLGIDRGILEIAKAKELKGLKKTDGKKRVRISGLPKLSDANMAGTSKSHKCTLIVTEGDSGKTTALSGLSVVGRDYYGVFPLKGKLLNTRDISLKLVAKNEEIINLNKIIGLVHGEDYSKDENYKKLRYGKLMIMTDTDVDGFHIKGLLFNYFSCFWPELLQRGFSSSLLTPIVKIFKGNSVKKFYNLYDYDDWKEVTPDYKTWRVKYYKGLGTSNQSEAKEYFSDLGSNQINYRFDADLGSEDQESIKLAFTESTKKNTDKRKEWILNTLKDKPKVDYNIKDVHMNDFVNKELVQFSIYDNERSIPSVIDGLKVSQRKILYGCLKRKLFLKADHSGEVKVAQLSGYVAEHSCYHHGEVSLQGAIINMAQDFVGSNNMNILFPSGQFGSRQMGGKDSSSPRYIFTYLNNWVKDVFNEHDNQLLNYLDDDGTTIEPEFYVPTIPMILVNGVSGIATGWSTSIPPYNPKDLVSNLKALIKDENSEIKTMHPWYRGFKGTITQVGLNEWRTEGVIEIKTNKSTIEIIVTELPVGNSSQTGKKIIQDFKCYLDQLEQKDEIESYEEKSTDVDVLFNVIYSRSKVPKWNENDFKSHLKLIGCIKTSNMHAFDEHGSIKKYENAEEILWDFYKYRKSFYVKRKKYLLEVVSTKLHKLEEKTRFIKMVVNGELVVFKRPKNDIVSDLEVNNFEKNNGTYNYLLDIKIHSFTMEKVQEYENTIDEYNTELKILKNTTIETMWETDLDKL